jgi:hypothetical protein
VSRALCVGEDGRMNTRYQCNRCALEMSCLIGSEPDGWTSAWVRQSDGAHDTQVLRRNVLCAACSTRARLSLVAGVRTLIARLGLPR